MARKNKTKKQIGENIHPFTCRRLVIIIENDSIGDNLWMPTVAESLRTYAAYVDAGHFGNSSPEILITENGNKMTMIGGSYFFEHDNSIVDNWGQKFSGKKLVPIREGSADIGLIDPANKVHIDRENERKEKRP